MNNYRSVILDASALIALIAEEKGHEKVAAILPKAIMSSVNVAEVGTFAVKRYGINKEGVRDLIEQTIAEVVDFNCNLAFLASELIVKTQTFGLSLGDRACLALALTTGYPILTADKIWSSLKIDGLHIEQLR